MVRLNVQTWSCKITDTTIDKKNSQRDKEILPRQWCRRKYRKTITFRYRCTDLSGVCSEASHLSPQKERRPKVDASFLKLPLASFAHSQSASSEIDTARRIRNQRKSQVGCQPRRYRSAGVLERPVPLTTAPKPALESLTRADQFPTSSSHTLLPLSSKK